MPSMIATMPRDDFMGHDMSDKLHSLAYWDATSTMKLIDNEASLYFTLETGSIIFQGNG